MLGSSLAVLLLARADHLVPERGVLSEVGSHAYEQAVRRLLLTDRVRDVQMVTLSSRLPEEAVYVRRRRGEAPVVVTVRARRQIHGEAQRPLVERARASGAASYTEDDLTAAFDALKVDVEAVEAPIAEDTVRRLEALWSAALLAVRYPTEATVGVDGTTYQFADWTVGFGNRAGTTWSPPAGSVMRALVGVGEALASYARAPASRRPALERHLITRAQALLPKVTSPR